MVEQKLGVHEAAELHELVMFKNLCLTKSSTMQGLVNDNELQTLMQQDIQSSTQAIQQLQGLLQK
ncbi:hypothetical protein [Thalassobacillus sp. C254]|uniref:hypothetical protein n=1 Tax=Thalassobacillus sp. C254 TaxID=1225341 RepID=UPI0006D051E8|nr:hypothetical protein [Thalassobacillus sp. C254]